MIQLITGFVWNYSTDFKISIYGKHKLQSKIELNSQEQWLSEVQTKKHIRYKSMFDFRECVGETSQVDLNSHLNILQVYTLINYLIK